jgi:hypothetical protein
MGDANYYKLIDEVTTCLIKDKETCMKSSNLCMLTETNENDTGIDNKENNICGLILPKQNLITNKENEPIYFGKMADELIRYNRIKSYILQPQTFLSFGNVSYNLRDDEIILLQSLLTQEYFESLVPAIINKYVRYNSYDEAEPIITQPYDNIVEKDKKKVFEKCNKKTNDKVTSIIWQNCFPKNFKEIAYAKSVYCTFDCILDIIEKKTGNRFEINTIKNILYDEYKKYLPTFSDKINDILIIEGKKHLGDKLKNNFLTFADFLYNDNYFLTTFDLWLLVNKYKISTIFISSKNLLQTNYEKNIFAGYSENNNVVEEKFCFIIIPALQMEHIPGYKIIQNGSNEIFISLNEIKIDDKNTDCFNTILIAIENKLSIDMYLENFKKIQKKRLLVEDVEDVEDVENIENVENIQETKKPQKGRPKKIEKTIVINDIVEINPENVKKIPKKRTRKVKQVVLKGQQNGGKTKKNRLELFN